VPTGQHLIGLDMTLQNQNPTPGASQVYGLRCTNDSPTFDTGACIGLWTDEADGMFVGVEGKSGTGVGIQRNPRNRPDGAAYGYQCSSFGPGSCMYPRRQVNMNDWNQRLVKLRANNNAISIEQDSTRTPGHPLITVESPGGVGHELISTNDGSMARTAGAGDFWAGNQRVIVTGDTTIENPHGQVLLRVRADGCLVLKSGTMIC
jgi:hypothetical protein